MNSLIVAQDGSGDYETIQAAVNAIPDNGEKRQCIYIKGGVYEEKIVMKKKLVSFIGIGDTEVILTYGDGAKTLKEDQTEMGTLASYSVLIAADGFIAKNITFRNHVGPGHIYGQGLAVYSDGDRLEYHNCRFIGHQDTIFTAPAPATDLSGAVSRLGWDGANQTVGRQYFYQCYIEGDVDFIFGSATAIFSDCEIYSLDRNKDINGYITAASTQEGEKFGYVFLDCRLTSDAAPSSVYLGRPWRNYAKTAFINCWMGEHIIDVGWLNWGRKEAEETVEYAEFGSKGPGGNMDKRVEWSKRLTAEEANEYSIQNIFEVDQNWTTWE